MKCALGCYIVKMVTGTLNKSRQITIWPYSDIDSTLNLLTVESIVVGDRDADMETFVKFEDAA